MSKCTYAVKIFEPDFAYHCAARYAGERPELKAMLDAIGNETNEVYTEEHEKVYPHKTLYYSYEPNILVITHMGDGFMGQTFKNGIAGKNFDMQAEKQEAQAFFKEAGEGLSVIDFFTGKQLKPEWESVENYMERVTELNRAFDEHREQIADFKERYKALRSECEAFYCTSPSTSYKQAVNLLEDCITMAEATFSMKYSRNCRELEAFLKDGAKDQSLLKMFGLYVFMLKFGTEHRRFLRYGAKTMSLTFNHAISEMRKFVSGNEGIVDKYIDYMNLTKNERENLLFLLSEEELMTYGKSVGDDLFA